MNTRDAEASTDLNRCFNEGSDARLRGYPAEVCPYSGKERFYWLAGWRSVHLSWGEDVHGRWRYSVLPFVRE